MTNHQRNARHHLSFSRTNKRAVTSDRKRARRRLALEPLEDRRLLAAADLDLSFGNAGLITTDFLDHTQNHANAVLVQTDGKILAGGSAGHLFSLTRFNNDGTVDTTFGAQGSTVTRLTVERSLHADEVSALAVQGDGKIVAAGTASVNSGWAEFGLVRYNSDGSLDTSFAGNGVVRTDLGGTGDTAEAMAIQPDGKIVVAGTSVQTTRDFALSRYNTDGTLDATFGVGGLVTTDINGESDLIYDLVLQTDGKIVVAGDVGGAATVARYNSDGSLDTSFDGDGLVTPYVGRSFGVALQTDGNIIVAGSNGAGGMAVARLTATGSLDPSFNGDGFVSIDLADGVSANDVTIQSDGKIVVVGSAVDGADTHFGVARLNTDGSIDATFEGGGSFTTDFAGLTLSGNGVALGTDGSIVLAGQARAENGTTVATGIDIALARYSSNGTLDTTFDGDGRVTADVLGPAQDLAHDVVTADADGKLYVVGRHASTHSPRTLEWTMARYNADGTLDDGSANDTTPGDQFGTDGRVALDIQDGSISSLAIQPGDNKIVVVGGNGRRPTPRLFVARYNDDGSLDDGSVDDANPLDSFGTNGVVSTNISSAETSLAIQTDGKILVGGSFGGARRGASGIELLRLNDDGSVDTSFGTSGTVKTTISPGGRGDDLALQSDGRIVVVGTTSLTSSGSFAVARYLSDGSLDSSFGVGGLVTTDIATSRERARAVKIQTDGKIVVAGFAGSSTTLADTNFALARYNSVGTLDTTFSADGIAITDFAGDQDEIYDMEIQTDGRIVVAGISQQATTGLDFAVARYDANGALDTTFDLDDGKVTTDFGDDDWAFGMTLSSNGKIFVSGYTEAAASYRDFAIAGYVGESPTVFIQDAPTAEVDEGTQLSLNSSINAVANPVYAWTIDGVAADYNVQGSSTSSTLDLTLFNEGTFTVTLDVFESGQPDPVASDTKVIDVVNVTPSATLSNPAPSLKPNGSFKATYAVTEPGENDIVTVEVDYDDGQGFEPVALTQGGSKLVLEHTYADTSTAKQLKVKLTDGTGTYDVENVLIIGTGGADSINVDFGSAIVTINGDEIGRFEPTGTILVFGLDGDDVITIDEDIVLPTVLDGGEGDDTLQGGSGDNQLIGGPGFDTVVLASGENEIVGGAEQSIVSANSDVSITIPEGDTFHLVSTGFTDPSEATIEWGDGVSESGVVGDDTVTGSHVYADDGEYSAVISVTDDGELTEQVIHVTVNNVAPTITATSNSSAACESASHDTVSVSVEFSDPGFDFPAAETSEDFLGSTIDWGDGTIDESPAVSITEISGSAGTATTGTVSGTHTYSAPGIYTVTVEVVDDDGGTVQFVSSVMVAGVEVIDGVLVIVGTSDDDRVTVNPKGSDQLKVHADFLSKTSIVVPEVEQIVAHLCGGDDHMTISGSVKAAAILDGGDGADRLSAGGGDSLLLGGEGADFLFGGGGSSVLVGGQGEDRLVGGKKDDVLIGGDIADDDDTQALWAVLAAWTSDDAYDERVAALDALLTVLDDGDEDSLTGAAGRDLFYDGLNDALLDVKTKKDAETVL